MPYLPAAASFERCKANFIQAFAVDPSGATSTDYFFTRSACHQARRRVKSSIYFSRRFAPAPLPPLNSFIIGSCFCQYLKCVGTVQPRQALCLLPSSLTDQTDRLCTICDQTDG